jgi:photosystem II stability/assembly factor-like uncharacterized protein
MSALELTVLHAARAGAGHIGAFAIGGGGIVAAGGSTAAPTVLASANARDFEALRPPRELGLRDVAIVDDAVWICGEYGQLAWSRDRGATWRIVETGTDVCLFALEVGPDGTLWVVGDRGYAARVVDDRPERIELGTAARLAAAYALGDRMLVLCGDGVLRTWRRGEVGTIATGATRLVSAFARTRRGTWIVVGDGGFIARSPDGTWFARGASGVDVDLEAIGVLDDGRVVVVGDRGLVLVSSDDGRTWKPHPTETDAHLWAVERHGYALLIGGDGGLVMQLEGNAFEQIVCAGRLAELGVAPWLCALFAGEEPLAVAGSFRRDRGSDEPLCALLRAFVLDHDVAARLEVARAHESRIVRDAAVLVEELRGGRHQLGTIADVHVRLVALRAMNLDGTRS